MRGNVERREIAPRQLGKGGGGDHVSVGYTGPGVTSVTVIPGSMLLPFNINAAPVFAPASYAYSVNAATATLGVQPFVNPTARTVPADAR